MDIIVQGIPVLKKVCEEALKNAPKVSVIGEPEPVKPSFVSMEDGGNQS